MGDCGIGEKQREDREQQGTEGVSRIHLQISGSARAALTAASVTSGMQRIALASKRWRHVQQMAAWQQACGPHQHHNGAVL